MNSPGEPVSFSHLMPLGLLLALILPGPSSLLLAQVNGKELPIPRTEHAPKIDGTLDDPAWEHAAVLDQWVQTKPGDNVAPHGSTVAYLTYDRSALYIAIRAKDEPGKIRARLHERDNVVMQGQDWIGIQLDPSNDRRRAFSLYVNPLGVQGDGLNVEGTGFQEWDTIFESAGRVGVDEYTIEIAIPFKSLRYPAREPQRWGFALERAYGRDNASDSPWPKSRDVACDLCQMITLTGMSGIAGGRDLEVNPTVLGRVTSDRPALGRAFDPTRTRSEFGLNVKYGLTPDLRLDATYNPDFSQIESDAGQLQINNRFALFFPEKRPFFLEGTDIFLTRVGLPGLLVDFYPPPVDLFYSRRIIDPDAGVKVTGKVGRLSLGMLGALDAAGDYEWTSPIEGIAAATLDPFRGTDARVGVARAKLDVLSDGFIGATVTERQFGDGHSLVGALDTRLRFGSNVTFRLLAARSDNREPNVMARVRPAINRLLHDSAARARALDSLPAGVRDLDGEQRQGNAIQSQLEYKSRHWDLGGAYLDITPDFTTPLGFTPRTDQVYFIARVGYTHRGTGFIREFNPKLRVEEGYDHGRGGRLGTIGAHTDRVVNLTWDWKLAGATDVGFGYARSFYRIQGIPFPDLDRGFLYVASQAIRRFGWDIFIRVGEDIIYDDIVDAGPALPDFYTEATVTTTTRPFNSLRIDLSLAAQQIWRRSETRERESRYAESAIPRVKAQLQVSKRLGFRILGEYRIEQFFKRDRVVADRRERLSGDLLATYLIHPGQSVLIGWSTLASGDLDHVLRPSSRGGVAKVSYLWRL